MLDRKTDGPTGYDRLASRLASSDTIITLNYDTMLDSALHRNGWDPANGYALAGTKKKFKWKPIQLSAGATAIAPMLLKLHGSANWFVRGNVSTLKRVFTSKPVRITPPRENELAHHVRQVVPPMFGKLFDHSQSIKAERLHRCGFSNADVAALLGTTTNAINVALHRARKTSRRKSPKAKKK
jgi:hypothetical protein